MPPSPTLFLPIPLALAATAAAQHAAHGAQSPCAREPAREIASLSEDDLAEIARGGGWGLARAAELNGVPGPTHLLEPADEIGLDGVQRASLEAIRDEIRAAAIAAGKRFVAAERALDAGFTDAVPDLAGLMRLVEAAGAARAALRLVHLSAHLRTIPLLTEQQVERSAVRREYVDDPCGAVPEGHDAATWRRHNGCD